MPERDSSSIDDGHGSRATAAPGSRRVDLGVEAGIRVEEHGDRPRVGTS